MLVVASGIAYEVGGFLGPLGYGVVLCCVVGAGGVVKVEDENKKVQKEDVNTAGVNMTRGQKHGQKHGLTIRVTMRKERTTKSRVPSARFLGL